MTTQKEICSFFRGAPIVGVSDAAGLLHVDETVVRRWCRENDIHRLGPNFALTPEDVAELAAALDDEEIDEEDGEGDEEADEEDDDDHDDEEDGDANDD